MIIDNCTITATTTATYPDADAIQGYCTGKGCVVIDGYYKNGRFYGYDGKVLSTVKIVPLNGICVKINATNFPDDNFRAIVKGTAINENGDDDLSWAEVLSVTSLDLTYKEIKDLTGIEYFKALTVLYSRYNSLKSLDVSKNTALRKLYGEHNLELKTLNVSKNRVLEELWCEYSSLESLDVTNNTALKVLHCDKNNLKSLNVTKNTALTYLRCSVNSLESLDVSKNTALTYLECSWNNFESLDISKNTALKTLICHRNQIKGSNMDNLVSNLPDTQGTLVVFREDGKDGNVITNVQVNVAKDKGWKVNKESKNENDDWVYVDYAGAFVDIPIDATNFPDDMFRTYLLSQDYGKDAKLTEKEIEAITMLNVGEKGIKDLTGIGHFTALTYLGCSFSSLESLDVSKNTALKQLNCRVCGLKSLDVSKNTALNYLICSDNSLESLDVTKNTALWTLDCNRNNLKSLDVSKNTSLKTLRCFGNQIKGSNMDNLVNSLPNTQGTLLVCSDRSKLDNVITKAQVKAATDKGWKVQKYMQDENGQEETDYAGLGDVNGDNNINQADLDLLVQIVIGQLPVIVKMFAGDLNHDGKTDAADIVTLVNILNGK